MVDIQDEEKIKLLTVKNIFQELLLNKQKFAFNAEDIYYLYHYLPIEI